MNAYDFGRLKIFTHEIPKSSFWTDTGWDVM